MLIKVLATKEVKYALQNQTFQSLVLLIQAVGGKLHKEIHKLIVLVWNKEELPQEWINPLLFQFIRKAIE